MKRHSKVLPFTVLYRSFLYKFREFTDDQEQRSKSNNVFVRTILFILFLRSGRTSNINDADDSVIIPDYSFMVLVGFISISSVGIF